MRKILFALFSFSTLVSIVLFSSCDKKDMVESVAKSEYNELKEKLSLLETKYKKKSDENKKLLKQNRSLKQENEILSGKLKEYRHGFESMYE